MASEDRPGTAVTHEENEWEAQKDNFYDAYIVRDLTLRRATSYMIAHYGFRASHRQWERKAKHWGFIKYVPEDKRRQEQESSQPGQRRDRNYRRWELRNDRRRSRSVSSVRSNNSASDEIPARPRAASATGPLLTLTTSNEYFGEGRRNSDAHGFLHPDPSDIPSFSDDLASDEFDSTNPMYSTYDVEVPPHSQHALRSPVPPDHFPLEATLHKPDDMNSPVQLKVHYGQRMDLASTRTEAEVPEIFVSMMSMDGDLSSPLPLDHSPQATQGFQMSSAQIGSSQSGMSGVIPYFQQTSDRFEVPSGLPSDGSQSNYGSQYDPAIHSIWRNGIPDHDSSSSQPYQMEGYGGANSSMQSIDPSKDMTNEFIDYDAFTKDSTSDPIPMDPSYVAQSVPTVNVQDLSTRIDDSIGAGHDHDPYRLETDFCNKVEDYTETVLSTIRSFTAGNLRPSEQQKLEDEVNYLGISLSGELKIRLDNLITSLKRSQKDIDYTQKIRNQNSQLKDVVKLQGSAIDIYRQFMIEKGFNPDLELGIQGELQGPSPMKPEMFEGI